MSQNPVDGADEATTNAFYRALSAACRRRALRFLAANDPVPMPVLATTLADTDDGGDPATVHLQLYHSHVPLLVEAGLVRRTDEDLLTTTDRGEAAVEFVAEWERHAGPGYADD